MREKGIRSPKWILILISTSLFLCTGCSSFLAFFTFLQSPIGTENQFDLGRFFGTLGVSFICLGLPGTVLLILGSYLLFFKLLKN